jgi:hypothetical protein
MRHGVSVRVGHFAGSALGARVGARLGRLRRAGVHGPKIYSHPDALSKPVSGGFACAAGSASAARGHDTLGAMTWAVALIGALTGTLALVWQVVTWLFRRNDARWLERMKAEITRDVQEHLQAQESRLRVAGELQLRIHDRSWQLLRVSPPAFGGPEINGFTGTQEPTVDQRRSVLARVHVGAIASAPASRRRSRCIGARPQRAARGNPHRLRVVRGGECRAVGGRNARASANTALAPASSDPRGPEGPCRARSSSITARATDARGSR